MFVQSRVENQVKILRKTTPGVTGIDWYLFGLSSRYTNEQLQTHVKDIKRFLLTTCDFVYSICQVIHIA